MVIISDNNCYKDEETFSEHFAQFPYALSPFQKHAIQGIVEGNHVLVTAATGSGKTLPAEFAIRHFTNLGKRVIYCSPIKALSNQKTFDLAQKYPDISFGLLTGDTKTNPAAQVLIMTTEILMNKLFCTTGSSSFEMDIETELACVVFDELHYINDAHRGHVWEQSILMLPPNVQMVMLSATLDNPTKFANWVESSGQKQVVICSTDTRIVPLTHYIYINSSQGLFKKMKDKDAEKQVKKSLNRCLTIRSADGVFNTDTYYESKRIKDLLSHHNVSTNRKAVLNDLTAHLNENDMLPAICFVFSRKQVEQCADEIVMTDDSSNSYIIHRECDSIIRRLPNWREYAGLAEYQHLVKLLEKGIGIHHSGMIPVLREIVEFMISKKHIRLLFATESFAIGLDCPIKTAIFINLKKHDGGEHPRYLLSHEYTQMAGRAGRRGIDTVGHVVHCINLFDHPDLLTYKEILCGKPQKLVSKFQIYYSVVLNLFKASDAVTAADIEEFVNKSMYKCELDKMKSGLLTEIDELRATLAAKEAEFLLTRNLFETYHRLIEKSQFCANKKRKEIDAEIDALKKEHPTLEYDFSYYLEYTSFVHQLKEKESCLRGNAETIRKEVLNVLSVMLEYDVIRLSKEEEKYTLTPDRGIIASSISEINPVLIAIICTETNYFEDFKPCDLAAFFSLFTDYRGEIDLYSSVDSKFIFEDIRSDLIESQEIYNIFNPVDRFCYDLVDVIIKWCACENEAECRLLISEHQISIGDFTKAILKISTLSREMVGMCETLNKIDLMQKLASIDSIVLKYVATSQSLYL
jgi:superfamily II RNA helicase